MTDSSRLKPVSAIEIEIGAAVGSAFSGRTSRQVYRTTLVRKATRLPQKEFFTLSDTARAYINHAVDMINVGHGAPDYPDIAEVYRARLMSRQDSFDRAVRNTRINKKGASGRIKELMLEHGLRISPTRLQGMLLDEGYAIAPSTVKLVRTQFIRGCTTLWEKGFLKELPKGLEDV